jgi:sugar/nucleoside kinase (ribokinase family)
MFDVVIVGGANHDFLVRGSALPRPGAARLASAASALATTVIGAQPAMPRRAAVEALLGG